MVELVKPSELTAATTVIDNEAMVVDDGVAVRKATPVQVVDAGAPVPTENEAIAGVDNAKRMTALRVRQVLDSETAPSVLRAQAWAESATPPDPLIPTSKSAKSWAAEAAISEGEAQDHASDAAISAGQALAIKNSLLTDLQASASTLPAGTPATASYNPATLTVSFGIPTGPQGEQGIQGPEGPQGPSGIGDMQKSVYDPQNKNADAFSLANMTGTLALSKLEYESSASFRVVGRMTAAGPYTSVLMADVATPNSVAMRDGYGAIRVATPVIAEHATTKAYVDGLIPTWATISGKPAVVAEGANAAAARTSIGAMAKAGDTAIGAFSSNVHAIGNSSGLTITPTVATSNFKTLTNNGAFTLNAPSSSGNYSIAILVTNAASGAGAMTASGYSKVNGTFKTTADLKQLLTIVTINGTSVLSIQDAS